MKLHCGAGMHRIPGWISIDHDPACQPDVVHDLGAGIPFESASVRFLHSEDFLCCLPDLVAVRRFLTEAHRVLVPGGTMRLLVPSLERLIDGYLFRPDEILALWKREVGLPLVPETPGMLVNVAIKTMPFMFDRETLDGLLEAAGFHVRECAFNASAHAELRGLDLRAPRASVSIYLECDRP